MFDSIAVLLFVNMKVDTGEIPINTKENIRKKDPISHSDTEMGTLSIWVYSPTFFQTKSAK